MSLRALCVGRHPYLSGHICSIFRAFGLETTAAVGLEGALAASRDGPFDVVICEYDLLAMIPLEQWERDALLSRLPVVAVSLTRRPDEMHLLDVNSIAGFLYLPNLDHARVAQLFAGCQPVASSYALPLPYGEPARG